MSTSQATLKRIAENEAQDAAAKAPLKPSPERLADDMTFADQDNSDEAEGDIDQGDQPMPGAEPVTGDKLAANKQADTTALQRSGRVESMRKQEAVEGEARQAMQKSLDEGIPDRIRSMLPDLAKEPPPAPSDAPAQSLVPVDLPQVGETVLYAARPGIMRLGREHPNEFAAIVQSRNADSGFLTLLVIYDASDMRDEEMVVPWSPDNPHNSWKPLRRAGLQLIPEGVGYEVQALKDLVGDMRAQQADLIAAIFGGYERPKLSLFDIFADFEERFKAVESKVQKK